MPKRPEKTSERLSYEALHAIVTKNYVLPKMSYLTLEELAMVEGKLRSAPLGNQDEFNAVHKKIKDNAKARHEKSGVAPTHNYHLSPHEMSLKLQCVLLDRGAPIMIKPGPETGLYVFPRTYLIYSAAKLDPLNYSGIMWTPTPNEVAETYLSKAAQVIRCAQIYLKTKLHFDITEPEYYNATIDLFELYRAREKLFYQSMIKMYDTKNYEQEMKDYAMSWAVKMDQLIDMHFPIYCAVGIQNSEKLNKRSAFSNLFHRAMTVGYCTLPADVPLPKEVRNFMGKLATDNEITGLDTHYINLLGKLMQAKLITRQDIIDSGEDDNEADKVEDVAVRIDTAVTKTTHWRRPTQHLEVAICVDEQGHLGKRSPVKASLGPGGTNSRGAGPAPSQWAAAQQWTVAHPNQPQTTMMEEGGT